MKWFGKSWKAPICRTTEHVETPKGYCVECGGDIQEDDQGLLIPFTGPLDGLEKFVTTDANEVQNYIVYHLDCFLESVGVKRGNAPGRDNPERVF